MQLINRVGRRLSLWGLAIAFCYSYSLGLVLFHLVFRLPARVFYVTTNIAVFLNGLIFFPAIIWILYHRFISLKKKALEWEECEDAGERVGIAERFRADAERYPLDMGILAVIIVTYFYVFIGVTWYIIEEVPGTIAFYFCVMGLAVGIGSGYLEYFVTYYILRPLRKRYYPDLLGGRELKGVTMMARIYAMIVLAIIMPTILSAVAAMTHTTYAEQDQMMERCRQHAECMADGVSLRLSRGEQERAALHEAARKQEFEQEYIAVASIENAETETVLRVVDTAGNLDAGELQVNFAEKITADETSGSFLGHHGRQFGAYAYIEESGSILLLAVPTARYLGESARIGLTLALVSMIIGLVLAVLAWVTMRTFNRPMSELVALTAKVGEGDIAAGVPLESTDEIGKLAFTFHRMLRGLREMIASSQRASEELGEEAGNTAASSQEVNASLEQLTSIAMELSQNASLQNDRAEEIGRKVGEMTAIIEKSFAEASSGVELSRSTSDFSDEGRGDASSTEEKMEAVQAIIAEAAEAIRMLGEKTMEIFGIVDVIKKISDQTNLLALNAAIEAAKAHEFGKGFGVVADEVRKLAAESAAASERIAILAREIKADSEESVAYMEKSSQEMATGMESVRQTGKTLETIYESAQKTMELSESIAAVTGEATERSNAITEAIEEIHSIATSNAASSQEMAASIEEQSASMQEVTASSQNLADLADRLRDRSRLFKTDDYTPR